MSEQATASEAADFERLRKRWELAKASGTTTEFARELFLQGETHPPSQSPTFGSAEERAAYEAACGRFGPDELLEMLPYIFGDVHGIPADEMFARLGIDLRGDRSEADSDGEH